MSKPIFSPSLKLLPCSLQWLDFILREEYDQLAASLKADIAPGWSTFGLEPFEWTREVQAARPEHEGWLTYLTIHLQDNRLIGTCGFKGMPDDDGTVEIGYEIAESYQLRGLATEAAIALIAHAFSFPEVKSVLAHTLPEINQSGSVLQKAGLKKIGTVEDPDDGAVWQWRIKREEFLW